MSPATAPVNRRRSSWLRRAARLLTLGLVVAVCGLIVPDSSVARTDAVLVKVEHAEGVALDRNVVWILAVGSDARLGEDMTRSRGDALQLIGVDTVTHAATSIGIPRDSWVSIDGYGSNRINASMFFGGPQLLARTVEQLVGIEPDYVFVTRFQYLRDMINDIGGITVVNPTPFSDVNLWPEGFPKGKLRLRGWPATAFGRIRHTLPNGDFDRSRNQQRVLVGIQREIARKATTPGFLEGGALTVLRHTATEVGLGDIFRLAQAAAQIDPKKLTGCVVTGSFANINGASVVLPDTASARSYGDQARHDASIEDCHFGEAKR